MRIVSSILLILIAVSAISINWVCGVVVTLFIGLALYEFFTLIQKKGILIYRFLGILIGIAIPLTIAFRFEWTKGWEFLLIVSACLALFILQFTRRDSSQAIVGISTTLFGLLYVSWFFSFLIKIRYLPGGAQLLGSLLLITKGGDIGAYLVGTNWGRHNLISRISPQKSIEGAVGGLGFSLMAAVLSKIFLPNLSFLHLLPLGILLGILTQLGDLSESLIKRDCQVKDSGRSIPGLGGVLDVIDSLLFTAPAFYFYMVYLLKRGLL